jgi:hypothetical protein
VIRELNLFDFDIAIKIARLKNRSGGTTVLSDEVFHQTHHKYFENNGVNNALGYFENDILISWVALGLHENQTRGRFWYISFLYTSIFHNSFSFNNIEMGSLIKACFELAEKQGYYEYYYTVAQRVEHVYDRQWARNNFMQTGRYECTVIGQIEANTQPIIDLYWRLLGCEIRPDTIIVKKRVLNLKFRK